MTERDNGMFDIDATIICERESHKGIVIGKGGQMLKAYRNLRKNRDRESYGHEGQLKALGQGPQGVEEILSST